MFKKSYNRAIVQLEIETVSPLLIRAGDTGLDPSASDLAAVRTTHPRWGSRPYVPGSSMKGTLRSAAEASVRGHRLGGSVDGACDTLGADSCGGRYQKLVKDPVLHKEHCASCRAFGSTAMKGRVSIRDLFPWTDDEKVSRKNVEAALHVETRHGVAINRISGGVQHGPFDQELVPTGVRFFGDVGLDNYQVWQLGLLAAGLDELNEGFARLGSSKSRGLGGVRARVTKIIHEQTLTAPGRPLDVSALAGREGEAYGLMKAGALPEAKGGSHGLRRRFIIEGEQATRAWLEAGLEALSELVEAGT